MKKVLIVTTLNDLSLGLFATRKISEKFQVIFHFINESIDTLSQSFLREFDVIYIRDPFTDGYSRETLNEKLLHIINIAHLHDIRMIDSIVSLEDIYIEDKWLQYGKFSQYQTKTHLLNEYTNRYGLPESGTYIIKSRVSSRAKGIYFDIAEIGWENHENYVIQEMLDIKREYRVYVLSGKILETVSEKSPKTPGSKVKIVGYTEATSELKKFVADVVQDVKYDCIWLDVAEVGPWEYTLIELNRSPQFTAFYRKTGLNIAEMIF